MVVDGIAARACLLVGGRQLAYVPMVVVHPHEGNVVGDLQPQVVYVQHLLVGDEHLRNPRWVAKRVRYQLSLVFEHFRQSLLACGGSRVPVHSGVVQTPHAQGIYRILPPALSYAVCPVAFHHVAVGQPVPVFLSFPAILAPFVHVVPQHLLAVARPHVDVVFADERDVCLLEPECPGPGMHGRPQRVGPEA